MGWQINLNPMENVKEVKSRYILFKVAFSEISSTNINKLLKHDLKNLRILILSIFIT